MGALAAPLSASEGGLAGAVATFATRVLTAGLYAASGCNMERCSCVLGKDHGPLLHCRGSPWHIDHPIFKCACAITWNLRYTPHSFLLFSSQGTITFALKEVADRRLLSMAPPRGLNAALAAASGVQAGILGFAMLVSQGHSHGNELFNLACPVLACVMGWGRGGWKGLCV